MYQKTIAAILQRLGRTDIDPRHVEAYIRLEHSTPDGLSFDRFVSETKIGIACVDAGGRNRAEQTAKSFGL